MLFNDRREAGRLLAGRLLHLKDNSPVVLALPRGGVPVGFEVARALAAPLDLVLVRKIGAPHNEEFAVGAITDGEHPTVVIDQHLVRRLEISSAYLDEAKTGALAEIERRRHVWLGDRPAVDISGRTAIVVDDGIATGATMRAALQATRARKPARVVLAVPVAAPDSLDALRREADDVVCLDVPEYFRAGGQFYRNFPQLRDAEVTALLAEAQALNATG
jgi:putative phosphoribosyl transferase